MDLNHQIILDNAEKIAKYGRSDAKRFFESLDGSLAAAVRKVVVPVSSEVNRTVVFGDGDDLELADLQSLRSVISDFPDKFFRHLAPDVRGVIWGMRVDAKKALQKTIDEELESTDRIAFVSLPLFTHNLCVFAVLELGRHKIHSYYSIPGESHWGWKREREGLRSCMVDRRNRDTSKAWDYDCF